MSLTTIMNQQRAEQSDEEKVDTLYSICEEWHSVFAKRADYRDTQDLVNFFYKIYNGDLEESIRHLERTVLCKLSFSKTPIEDRCRLSIFVDRSMKKIPQKHEKVVHNKIVWPKKRPVVSVPTPVVTPTPAPTPVATPVATPTPVVKKNIKTFFKSWADTVDEADDEITVSLKLDHTVEEESDMD